MTSPTQAETVKDEGTYRHLVTLALPLILGTACQSLMLFTDRLYLNRIGAEALAASFSATVFGYLCQCFFIGTAGYVAAFAAQHRGAGEHRRCGPWLGPALGVALAGGAVGLALIPALPWIYGLMEPAPGVLEHMLTLGRWFLATTLPVTVIAGIGGFFAGIGRTGLALGLNIAVLLLNAGLNAVLAFGLDWGVQGVAIGAFLAATLVAVIALAWVLSPGMHRAWGTRDLGSLGWSGLGRYLATAAPQGGRMLLEILSWTVFGFVLGRFGTVPLAASNIAISWNMLTFIPMMGLSTAIAVAVGHALGGSRPDDVPGIVRRGLTLELAWAGFVAIPFVLTPGLLLLPFPPPADLGADQAAAVATLTATLLAVAALWGLGDAFNTAYSGALNGAGDTRWQLWATLAGGIVLQWLPLALVLAGVVPFGLQPVVAAWLATLFFSVGMGALMWWRFHTGAWRQRSLVAVDLQGAESGS